MLTAGWDAGAVLSSVADAVGEDPSGQIRLQLPAGFDVFFGRPQST